MGTLESQEEDEVVSAEDAEDIAAFKERASEPELPFDEVVEDLRRRGLL